MRRSIVAALFVMMAAGAASATEEPRAVDSVALARELYSAAEYENALQVLERLRASVTPSGQRTAIEEYRAFCLLALGREADGEQAMADLVMLDPTFVPAGADISPRLQTVFGDVRRRTLPSAIQQLYETAKAAFDRQEFAVAAVRFAGVVRLLADPDAAEAAAAPPLSDLKTLAEGFGQLSTAAAAPPAPPVTLEAAAPHDAPTDPTRVFGADDGDVRPPVPLKQQLPAFSTQMGPIHPGTIELVVDEKGLVESVVVRESVNPRYDRVLADAARTWVYQPATRNGAPVKFRKQIRINVKK
jgi:hypothetical protein